MSEFKLGRLYGLQLSALPSAIGGAILLWFALIVIAIGLLNFPIGAAILAALIASALHWFSDTLHQLGHARAARQTGQPMIGIRYWGVLSASIYPTDEPVLPAELHIRRALGGPLMSSNVVIAAAVILFVLRLGSTTGAVWWLAVFFLCDNLFIMTLGALLPLGFTDGSTLLYWRNRK